jgi:hypothetical protein
MATEAIWKQLLWNRFSLVFGLLCISMVGWNIYVELHNDGTLFGQVVGAHGEPVASAQVTVNAFEQNVVGPPTTTMTDAQGRFAFYHLQFFQFIIKAEKDGWKPSTPVTYHLWFRSQNFILPEPLRLEPIQ